MIKLIVTFAITMGAFSTAVASGTSSNPESRGWVDVDGRLYSASEAAKLRAEKAARWAKVFPPVPASDLGPERVALMERYIAKHGRRSWEIFGARKPNSELRKGLGVLAIVSVGAAAVGANGNAEAATVKVSDPDVAKDQVVSRPEPGTTAPSYRAVPAPTSR